LVIAVHEDTTKVEGQKTTIIGKMINESYAHYVSKNTNFYNFNKKHGTKTQKKESRNRSELYPGC